MNMANQLRLALTSSQATKTQRITSNLPASIRMYSEGSKEDKNVRRGILDEERAPSTAEEFKRVAAERTRQGSVGKNIEKTTDGAEETIKSKSG